MKKFTFLSFLIFFTFLFKFNSFASSVSYSYLQVYDMAFNSISTDKLTYPISSWVTVPCQVSYSSNSYQDTYVRLCSYEGQLYFCSTPQPVGGSVHLWFFDPKYYLMTGSSPSYTRVSNVVYDSGDFEHDVLDFPPAFPFNTGLSYSTPVVTEEIIEYFSYSSQGVTIPDGYSFALCEVTFSFKVSSFVPLSKGSYVFSFVPGGSGSVSGTFPDQLLSSSGSYLVDASFNVGALTIDAFQPYNTFYTTRLYLSIYSTDSGLVTNERSIKLIYFVTDDVPSFNYKYTPTVSYSPFIFRADSNEILNSLNNQNNYLSSASGANSGMNSQNQLVSSALSDYQRDTDTTAQYNNISDSLFVPDISVFTQMVSTISFFSSVITGLFTHIGDLAVPLTMFLVFVFISSVLGIHNFVVSSNDRMETKSTRNRSSGKKGD